MFISHASEEDPFSDPTTVSSRPPDNFAPATSKRLRCKMCRRELATENDIVSHDPGKGEVAFEPHKRDSVRKGLDKAPISRQKGAADLVPPGLARMQRMLGQQPRGLLPSSACSAYFVEPLVWMTESSDVVEGVLAGRLICPNTHCHAKLGSWTWAGTQCAWYVYTQSLIRGSGAWVTPAFALQRAKVDEVNVRSA